MKYGMLRSFDSGQSIFLRAERPGCPVDMTNSACLNTHLRKACRSTAFVAGLAWERFGVSVQMTNGRRSRMAKLRSNNLLTDSTPHYEGYVGF